MSIIASVKLLYVHTFVQLCNFVMKSKYFLGDNLKLQFEF